MVETRSSKEKRRMEKFTEDLVAEILVNLRVKSLLRFKCVCRSWFDLIKNPNFIRMHLNHHKGNDNIMMLTREELKALISFHSYESLSLILPNLDVPHESVGFCGPCDGLICFSNMISESLMLCNPGMREFKLLPPYPYAWGCYTEAIGLGFDSHINDYKIVVIVKEEEEEGGDYEEEEEEEGYFTKAMVYNLGTNSWREIDYGPVSGNKYLECYGTLFNGTLHWISRSDNKIAVTFDMNTEVFSSLEIPYVELEEVNMKHFMILNGSLAMITSRDKFLSIWVMHIYGDAESWTRQLVIGPLTTVIIRPFFRWKNGVLFVQNVYSQLVSISLGTNELTVLNTQGVIVNAIVYQESLISIMCDDAIDASEGVHAKVC